MSRSLVTGSIVAIAVMSTVALGPAVVGAAGTSLGAWSVTGANPSWTGSLTVAATGFPGAGLATNSNTPSTPSAAFLNASTPFGAVFGSTSGANYLNAAAAAGQTPSTTTITFASPTPPTGWGFAFGDIDADQIQITATGPSGLLSAADLGFQSVFNYCTPSTPRPASCGGAQTDTPSWSAATSTLVGGGADTAGASGWFRPTAPITSMTLTFTVQVGIPSFQMWVAATTAAISGSVVVGTGSSVPAPAGTTLRLLAADGSEVATTTVAADGSYSFPDVVSGNYDVAVVRPAGYEVVGAGQRPADASAGDVAGLDFVLQLTPPVTTTTTATTVAPTTVAPTTVAPATTLTPSTTTPPSAAPATVPPPHAELPATGWALVSAQLIAAGIVGGLGIVLVARTRRPASTSPRPGCPTRRGDGEPNGS